MTHQDDAQDDAQATSRLRHAVMSFQTAQVAYLGAYRRMRSWSLEKVDAFWDGPGLRLEVALRTSAEEVIAAFAVFSAAGLVASASERHLVTEARRTLNQGAAWQSSPLGAH